MENFNDIIVNLLYIGGGIIVYIVTMKNMLGDNTRRIEALEVKIANQDKQIAYLQGVVGVHTNTIEHIKELLSEVKDDVKLLVRNQISAPAKETPKQ